MIVGVLQARMSSRRLPGKVLEPLLGRPMIARQLERIGRCRRLDALVVATSRGAEDDEIVELCGRLGAASFRGDLTDVLDRIYHAAARHRAGAVVRLTADCPLSDPQVIDRLIELFQRGRFDYASNTLNPTWPDGLDAEIMSFATLQAAWREATAPGDREHVTPYIYRRPERFALGSLCRSPDLSGLRWTVDEPADLEFVRAVYQSLYPRDPAFTSDDVIDLLRTCPEVARLSTTAPRSAPGDRA